MGRAKNSLLSMRAACVVVTLGALCFVVHRIHVGALLEAVRGMRPGWCAAAVVLYGVLFLPASWRWHLALRLTDSVVHLGATARLSLIGHFFYAVLFGAAGGDTAKSALYARWYHRSLPEVLVAASLDRLLGFCGLVLFMGLACSVAFVHGAFSGLHFVSVKWPLRWLLLAVPFALALLFLLGKSRWSAAVNRFFATFKKSGARLLRSPKTLFPGVVCGFLVQMALSGVLALNLQAVTHAPLPWLRLAWTFPLISIVSALPVTVAGIGVRDTAALALLSLNGVAGADAVAASLLSAGASLVWTIIAGILLWRETARQQKRPAPTGISAVIPTLNDEQWLAETVHHARAIPEIAEIIVSDGGSSDRTRERAAELGCRVLNGAPDRAAQLQRGTDAATGDVILLLHVDTRLPANGGTAIRDALRDTSVVGGGFWKASVAGNLFQFGSRFRCALRLYLGRRVRGDQTIFARREVLQRIGSAPDVPLMKDSELCRRLRKAGRLALADSTAIISTRQCANDGTTRARLRMCWVGLRCFLGLPREKFQNHLKKE